MEPQYKLTDYSHKFSYRVRSHECDRQGIVHNARYLEMLEIARIEFCRDVLKIPMDSGTFATHHKFVFVRNAMNYFSPAKFDDDLVIYTRISKVGTSSISIEQIIDYANTPKRILEAEAVMVLLDEQTNEPKPIGKEIRDLIPE
ncbi:MAG TPA: thioesterase family protein [Candidatus Kapabacteria bacterium]|nr:thioesterase family protein [Candidatus Kapabacteria bacterium]